MHGGLRRRQRKSGIPLDLLDASGRVKLFSPFIDKEDGHAAAVLSSKAGSGGNGLLLGGVDWNRHVVCASPAERSLTSTGCHQKGLQAHARILQPHPWLWMVRCRLQRLEDASLDLWRFRDLRWSKPETHTAPWNNETIHTVGSGNLYLQCWYTVGDTAHVVAN